MTIRQTAPLLPRSRPGPCGGAEAGPGPRSSDGCRLDAAPTPTIAKHQMTMSDDLPQPPERMTGGCMCGAVRYTIAEKPLATGLCHCNRCRPQSGSAFSTVIFVHRSAVTITGETAVFDDIGSSGLRVLRRYCPRCGSPLTTEADVTGDIMFVKAGGIDSNEWYHPDLEMFVTRRRPWVSPVTGATQFEGNPEF